MRLVGSIARAEVKGTAEALEGGFVDGHCVDFIRDQVNLVGLAEAHVRFENVYWLLPLLRQ